MRLKGLGLVFFLLISQTAAAVEVFTIYGGAFTGTYFPMSVVICNPINEQVKSTELFCNVEFSGGSVDNIASLTNNNYAFAMVQSDVVYQAYRGEERFTGKPHPQLRSIMAIYPEVLSLVVNQKAKIKTLQDLKGKRISIGKPGSGTYFTVNNLFAEMNLSLSDLVESPLNAEESVNALKEEKIDGYFFMAGHPNVNVETASRMVNIDIIPLEDKLIENLTKKHPYYLKGEVPGRSYERFQKAVPTIGVKAVLVTSADAPDKIVELIIKTVLDNFWLFKRRHPLLAQKAVTEENLLEGLGAPLHPAAEKYYKQVGLLK